MNDDQIKLVVEEAIEAVKSETRPLDFKHVHERSIAHRLALHMERKFQLSDWDVDCEYDRKGLIRKELMGMKGCAGKKTDLILPDIIVHRRQMSGAEHNLLVMEIKKCRDEDKCDFQKLMGLTDCVGRFSYKLGAYVNVDGGKFNCKWFRNGRELE